MVILYLGRSSTPFFIYCFIEINVKSSLGPVRKTLIKSDKNNWKKNHNSYERKSTYEYTKFYVKKNHTTEPRIKNKRSISPTKKIENLEKVEFINHLFWKTLRNFTVYL